jgi:type II secretory ATPase GspE/PulE/Tfp pilus assembly ATPase PilB-like protein
LEAIIAQRLVRTVCPACKEEYRPDVEMLRNVGFPEDKLATKFYRGRGCDECRFTGYRGRMGIFEILIMNEAMRPLVIERTSSSTLKQAACAKGMRTLREDGWAKVCAGISTVEEVARVTQEDEELVGT